MYCWLCEAEGAARALVACDADNPAQTRWLDFCQNCGSGYLRDPPDEEALDRFYAPAYYGRGTRKFIKPVQWLFDRGKSGRAATIKSLLQDSRNAFVVDIGCGTGQLLEELADHGIRGLGLERAGAAARARPSVRVLEKDLAGAGLDDASCDAVILWHVLEHLRDPERALHDAMRILKDGGLLAIAVPDNGSCQAALFGRHWFHLDLPRHLHAFTQPALDGILRRQGYALAPVTTVEASQCLFGFVQSTYNLLFPSAANRFYRLLQGGNGALQVLELIAWSAGALLILPAALLELLVAARLGRSATAVRFAFRPKRA